MIWETGRPTFMAVAYVPEADLKQLRMTLDRLAHPREWTRSLGLNV